MTGPRPVPEGLTRKFFTPAQLAQARAVFEVIWPGGPKNPGATDAGVADYVDLLLGAPDETYYELRDWRPLYVAGLAMLNAAAIAKSRKPVDQLATPEITSLVTGLASGTLTTFPDAAWQQRFFSVLRAHCIEGCLADPRWGGNREAVIWMWLGYPDGQALDFVRS
jgi:hypothetical protein